MNTQKFISKNYPKWQKQYNLRGVGEGYIIKGGRITRGLVFSVPKKLERLKMLPSQIIPSTIRGIYTDVVEVGELMAPPPIAPTSVDRKKRHRPSPCGVSNGHKDITAGTQGCVVGRSGLVCVLSNNHVYANSNKAELGDPILQPGPYDGGAVQTDTIATLLDFVPIHFDGEIPPTPCPVGNVAAWVVNLIPRIFGSHTRLGVVQQNPNLVDAAIARVGDVADISKNILELGFPEGHGVGKLGDKILKSGRTTGVTNGTITQVGATVSVNYGDGKIAVMEDQLIAGAMSQGGDSGSVVLNSSNQVVGLLFAGSENTTVINRIEHVIAALGITI